MAGQIIPSQDAGNEAGTEARGGAAANKPGGFPSPRPITPQTPLSTGGVGVTEQALAGLLEDDVRCNVG